MIAWYIYNAYIDVMTNIVSNERPFFFCSSPLMVIVQKLTMVAYALHDGERRVFIDFNINL